MLYTYLRVCGSFKHATNSVLSHLCLHALFLSLGGARDGNYQQISPETL